MSRVAQGEPLRVAHRAPVRGRDRVPRIEVQFLGRVVILDLGVKNARAQEARGIIGEFIVQYNTEWLIERLGHRTPAQARADGLARVA